MKYIQYTGRNGFQTYGFVKDNSHKLDKWKMRFSRIAKKRVIRTYSLNTDINILIEEGQYLYVDELSDYQSRFKVSNRNPFLLLMVNDVLKKIKGIKTYKQFNAFKEFLEND